MRSILGLESAEPDDDIVPNAERLREQGYAALDHADALMAWDARRKERHRAVRTEGLNGDAGDR